MHKSKKKLPVIWDVNERNRFKELIQEIKKRSKNLSDRIKESVKEKIELVCLNPMLFEADYLKKNNDGSFRKFTAIHIRVVYKIEPDKIIIVRIRHAASEPSIY